jgi:general secretion pathway protein G
MRTTIQKIQSWQSSLMIRLRQRAVARAGGAATGSQAGMTLLEIMIVLALIGLVTGSIAVALNSSFKKGQIKTAKIAVGQISQAAQQYMMENNSNCPTSLDDLVTSKNLAKRSKDPWGKDFTLKCPGTGDPDGVDITSSGPDRQEGTPDDIKSWER